VNINYLGYAAIQPYRGLHIRRPTGRPLLVGGAREGAAEPCIGHGSRVQWTVSTPH